jgi:hypothetical protein
MNPTWYLVGVFAGAFALGCLATYPPAYRRGWARATIEAGDRHRHRHGDRQETVLLDLPRAGRLPMLPDGVGIGSTTPIMVGTAGNAGSNAGGGGGQSWVFAGGWDEGPVPVSAEYELLTRTAPFIDDEMQQFAAAEDKAELPSLCAACGSGSCPGVAGGVDACPRWQEAEERRDRGEFLPTFPYDPTGEDETPSGFTRRMAREVDALIAAWEAQGNYDRHTIQAGE